jgi:hypothetical protein
MEIVEGFDRGDLIRVGKLLGFKRRMELPDRREIL